MFIVIELQTNNGKVGNFVTPYNDLNTAYQKYYSVLSAAAVSNVECHTALLVTETGAVLKAEHFKHESEASE